MVTIENAVVIGGRIVVAQADASSIYTVDIPPLGVIHAHAFKGIVGNPGGGIVIGEIEQVCQSFFASDEIEYGGTGIGTDAIVQVIDVIGNLYDTAGFVKDSAVEVAVADDGVNQVSCSC